MTAYLQPGDKIVLHMPKDWGGSRIREKENADRATEQFVAQGITVVYVIFGFHSLPTSILAVIREPSRPRIPAIAHLPKIPWQDPPEPDR